MFMAGQFGPILPCFQTSKMAQAILGFDRPVLAPHLTVIASMLTYFLPMLNIIIAFTGYLWESNSEIHPEA